MKDFQFEIVSKRIAELLKSHAPDKTHEEISQMTGIAPSVISKLKRCEGKTPSCETIFKFASAFNVSADWLLGLSNCRSTDETTKEICETTGLSGDTIDFLLSQKNSKLFYEHNIHKAMCKAVDYLVSQTKISCENENYHLALLPMFASYAELSSESTLGTDVYYRLDMEKNADILKIYTLCDGKFEKLSETELPPLPEFCDIWNDCNSFRDIYANSLLDNISHILRCNLEKLQSKRTHDYYNLHIIDDDESDT